MKIALYGGHSGEIRMMQDLLEDHQVVCYDNSNIPPSIDTNLLQNEDVIITLWTHRDLPLHTGKTPVIVYATNPLVDVEGFKKMAKQPYVTVVKDSDNCYPANLFPIETNIVIPHAIKPSRIPPYKGDIPRVAIVNRKPFKRWAELTLGLYKKYISFDEFFPSIPYEVIHIPDDKDFYEVLSHFRVVFYFSTNPYTLFMYEMMTMGMPMVGFYHSWIPEPPPMRKYLKSYSKDRNLLNEMLRSYLSTEPKAQSYNFVSFEQAKSQWNELLKRYEKK